MRERPRARVYTTCVARLLFVTGTPADVRGGSGTYVGISVLQRAVEGLGHEVELLAPGSRGGVSLLRRVLFNIRARSAPERQAPDVIVAFDWDGLFLARAGAVHVASIKGVIAEEATFERGIPWLRLTTEACEPFRIVGEGIGKKFEGNVATEFGVFRAIDLTHPARAQRGEDFVRPEPNA